MTGEERARSSRSRRARAGIVVTVAVSAVAAAVALGAGAVGGSTADALADEPVSSVGTAAVTRETLVRSEKHKGTVGYGEPRKLGVGPSAPADGDEGASGRTVTWLPEVGAVVDRGQQVWRTDDRPTIALFGQLPVYRELAVGVRGPDVAQLKENLTALGFGGFSADDRYTPATARAVRAWQKDTGMEESGRVGPEQVVVVGGAVRVASRAVEVGAAASSPMLSVTDVQRAISFDIDPSKVTAPDVGARVSVVLPGGVRAPGTVSTVGTPVEAGDGGDDGAAADGAGETKVSVGVALDEPSLLDGLDAGRVDVELDVEERPDVLAVPVTALVALAEGGYALEVGAEERRLVPVTPGMFARGKVEVSGEIAEGDEVVVPS